ncbi:MAG: hypothetical protein ACJ74Y_05730 [Bryobacteraceae bacterium]
MLRTQALLRTRQSEADTPTLISGFVLSLDNGNGQSEEKKSSEHFCLASLHSESESGMATTDDPLAAVLQYINAFNEGDGQAMAATFANPGAILDGMAPHVWLGPTASQDWHRDVLIEGEQHGASDYFVT